MGCIVTWHASILFVLCVLSLLCTNILDLFCSCFPSHMPLILYRQQRKNYDDQSMCSSVIFSFLLNFGLRVKPSYKQHAVKLCEEVCCMNVM